ncbi:MAG TPA: hypothetical protein VJ927_04735 [Actinomycetota bacterium]|nr:hypothetical protein [Actinomycetota bacterium]
MTDLLERWVADWLGEIPVDLRDLAAEVDGTPDISEAAALP